MMPAIDPRLVPLAEGLASRDGVSAIIDSYHDEEGYWWLRFRLDSRNPHTVETLAAMAWLFNNTFSAVADPVLLRPLTLDPEGGIASLCWSLEALSPDYSPDRALDRLLTPVSDARRSVGTGW